MKIYKIGNLPFRFTSRKQGGQYTIFSNGGTCEIRIKTELLDKNSSIVEEENFSELSDLTNRLRGIYEE